MTNKVPDNLAFILHCIKRTLNVNPDCAKTAQLKVMSYGLLKFSTLVIIFVHYVARSFCETIKLPKEMPKIAKCLKCLKLRYSIDFIKRKKQGM